LCLSNVCSRFVRCVASTTSRIAGSPAQKVMFSDERVEQYFAITKSRVF